MIFFSDKKRLNAVRELAKQAHKSQVDRAGRPYFNHLDRVSNSCKSISAKIVGYLHDIIEDGHITSKELWETGLVTDGEMESILLLTKNKSGVLHRLHGRGGKQTEIVGGVVLYIKENKIATEVKIADLTDNMDLTRYLLVGAVITEDIKNRHEMYAIKLSSLKRATTWQK